MLHSRLLTNWHYNRGLAWPVRVAHAGAVLIAAAARALLGWAFDPANRAWAPVTLVTLAALWYTLPRDEALLRGIQSLALRGDLRRELEALQQFGQGASSLIIGAVILLLDTRRRRRVLDWILAALLTLGATNLLKSLLGRPRPQLEDPYGFTGPLGLYPIPVRAPSPEPALASPDAAPPAFVLESAWTAGYPLASMPSRHAASAAVAAVVLSFLYPRLTWVVVPLACVVCFARVYTNAHYPSDVILGAALGGMITRVTLTNAWGVRGLDALWKRLIDPHAQPAWPTLRDAERTR